MFGKIGDYNRNLQVDDLGEGKLFGIWSFWLDTWSLEGWLFSQRRKDAEFGRMWDFTERHRGCKRGVWAIMFFLRGDFSQRRKDEEFGRGFLFSQRR